MPVRLFIDSPLRADASIDLPPGPTRHVQVLRLQPGGAITLFDGHGGEWPATIERIGRSQATVLVSGACIEVDRELPMPVTLALGMPANERMETVIEKATELGATTIQPLLCERSVLRLSGERAQKKVSHWQAVAVAACEQCGRTRVPVIGPVMSLTAWLGTLPADVAGARWRLGFEAARPLAEMAVPRAGVVSLSGPEGGLSPDEEDRSREAGFIAVSLGPRVLRADTAPLALLAHLGIVAGA